MPKSKKSSKKKSVKPTLHKVDWYGFNHTKVSQHFGGELTFVNYMNVGDKGDLVAAVYHAAKPDRTKGHKDYMLLWKYYDVGQEKEQWMVSGMTQDQIEKHAKVTGLLCLDCNKALWSLNRHHFHGCGCKNGMTVDGGKDYMHCGAKDFDRTIYVNINLLTDEISLDGRAEKR